MKNKEGFPTIEWSDNYSITSLILDLCQLLEQGYKTVRMETFETGDGDTEDGSYEFEYTDARLVADY